MRTYLLPIMALAAAIFAGFHLVKTTPAAARTEPTTPPSQSAYTSTVAAAGLVEAKTKNILVGSPVPGLVEKVFVQEGDRIRVGGPLFQLDTRHILAELKVRQAAVDSAEAQLQRLEAMPRLEELPPSEAQLREARANLVEREDIYRRNQRLVERQAISEEEVVRARQALEVAKAQLARAEAEDNLLRAGAWSFETATAKAVVAKERAGLAQTQTELDRHRIDAPAVELEAEQSVEFEVLQVNVRPGEYVSTPSSQPLMVLGVIGERHLRVDIDEYDIRRFQSTCSAVAYVRGEHVRPFPLTFVRVEPYVIPKRSLTGDNTERVDTRVLQVLYSLAPDAPVFIGQQMDVFIDASVQ